MLGKSWGVYETATPYQADNYQRQSRLNVVKPTKSYGKKTMQQE